MDRVQKEAAETSCCRRVKNRDERRELRQKLLEEANKKALKAQITAREIEEKRLGSKARKKRLEIKLKEEKLRKLKLYEANKFDCIWRKKRSGVKVQTIA